MRTIGTATIRGCVWGARRRLHDMGVDVAADDLEAVYQALADKNVGQIPPLPEVIAWAWLVEHQDSL